MSQHILPVRTYLIVFGTLLLLLLVTVAAAVWVDVGRWNLAIALTIAATKAVLIMLYFMHVRFSDRLTWVFSGAAFFWLGILLVLCLSDYTTRFWLPIPGK
jgi:cytochrome c oxidase subunit 4